jgi:hypothetical protein
MPSRKHYGKYPPDFLFEHDLLMYHRRSASRSNEKNGRSRGMKGCP